MEANKPHTNTNKIEELIERGKAKGILTYQEVMDTLSELELNSEQIERLYFVGLQDGESLEFLRRLNAMEG